MGVRLRLSAVEDELSLRRQGGGVCEGIRAEVLAGEHRP